MASGIISMIPSKSAETVLKNTSYGIDMRYKRSGGLITGHVMTNKLLTAIPYNTWTTILSNLPFDIALQSTAITNNGKPYTIMFNSRKLQIICRNTNGISVNDGFALSFAALEEP